jgi:prepilin-type processing-associated H-X9-DG protein
MQNHDFALKRFPSAYGQEQEDRPDSSWRVHLLPYIEERFLHQQYNFDEPWDGPNNSSLADLMPPHFRCPSSVCRSEAETSYLAIVGPDTAMPAGGKLGSRDIPDGLSSTLLAVDVDRKGVVWTEPRDIDAKTLNYQINPRDGTGLQGHHVGGINAVFCDGSVQFLSESIDPEVLKALTTRNGEEEVLLPF